MRKVQAFYISLVLSCLVLSSQSYSTEKLSQLLQNHSARLVQNAIADGGQDSRAVYDRFARLVAQELAQAGDDETAAQIVRTLAGSNGSKLVKTTFAWITHAFAREYYRDEIIQATSDLIKFKTFAAGMPNRQNPEFIRQKEYLGRLAAKLGLHFRDADGFIQEIWIGDGDESLGIMVHSDVQPVDENAWSIDPWSGEVKDGALWGRGAVDDKGPLAVIMYGMRALLDSGLPLKKKLILLVGTDEESANEDVSTYLQTHEPPDRTIVVDYAYPVICAEKGWCGIWLKLPRQSISATEDGLLVTDLQGGFSPSIVPGTATATLQVKGISLSDAKTALAANIIEFKKKRRAAKLAIKERDGTIALTAYGKSVHSSVPATGHNALIDLLVFLDQYVKPLWNEIALMAKFASTYIGLELNGQRLGIAHHDEFMGDVTVAGDMFEMAKDSVMFMFNFRIPKGIELSRIEEEISSRIKQFNSVYGVRLAEKRYLSTPHHNDPNSPFVQRLLAIYNGITNENRQAQSMGGGTYARRIPNAVVFGPTLPDEEYLGHQPNEHIKLTTLVRNIEILTHTLAEFGL